MRLLATLLLFILWTAYAQAQNLGASYLGMCHKTWPCEQSLRAFDGLQKINVAVLLGPTFGEECSCFQRLLQDPRPKEVNIKLANGPCLNNRRCGPYEIFAGESESSAREKIRRGDKRLRTKFQRWAARAAGMLQRAKGKLSCSVTTVLEHRFQNAEIAKTLEWIRPYFPNCRFVNNPQGNNPFGKKLLAGTTLEVHGPRPNIAAPCIADLDGDDFQKVDLVKYTRNTKQCEQTHIWGDKMNCIDHHFTGFQDPRKRNCGANLNYFRYVGQLLKPGFLSSPPAPKPVNPNDRAGCKGKLHPLPGEMTWKQSDTHPGVALLTRQNFRTLELRRDGKKIPFSKKGVFDGDKRNIYRTDTPSWEMQTNSVLYGDGACWLLEYPMYRID